MKQALEGVTVLDFSHLLQGPFATQMLGDLGANVIKIERPGPGDMFRTMTFNNRWLGGSESPNFLAWNRNKRSLALDLKAPEAKGILHRLAARTDVVVQNFRPGVLARLGFGYEDFRTLNPRIIYCSGSGYGDSGPYVNRPGQDMLLQGLTGLAANTGRADGPPTPVGAGMADQLGAMNMVYAILAALYYREKSGVGQEVKIDLLSGMLAHQAQELVSALNFDQDFKRPRSGIGHPGMAAPFGVYPTADGFITIAMSPFKKLVAVLGCEELLAFDHPETLFEDRDTIWEKLASYTEKRATSELMEALLGADIWCGEVKTHRQVAQDPQVKHLGCITSYQHPVAGEVQVVAPAIRMSETPAHIGRPAPLVGQHSSEVLRELGFSDADIRDYLSRGVVAEQTPPERA